jgi:hypothetical protein
LSIPGLAKTLQRWVRDYSIAYKKLAKSILKRIKRCKNRKTPEFNEPATPGRAGYLIVGDFRLWTKWSWLVVERRQKKGEM